MDKNNLNQVIHHPNRLKILTFLMSEESASFSALKEFTSLTDGNLGAHIKKLEELAYVKTKKSFFKNKPLTKVEITSKGKKELVKYVKELKSLISKLNV